MPPRQLDYVGVRWTHAGSAAPGRLYTALCRCWPAWPVCCSVRALRGCLPAAQGRGILAASRWRIRTVSFFYSQLLRYGLTVSLRVPIIHPCWSGGMLVFVESAAGPVLSSDVQARDPLGIGDRVG
jgi:hypothetical protein